MEHAIAGLDYWKSEQEALAAHAAAEEKKRKQAELEALGVHGEVVEQWGEVMAGSLKRQQSQMQAYKKGQCNNVAVPLLLAGSEPFLLTSWLLLQSQCSQLSTGFARGKWNKKRKQNASV